MDNFRIEEKDNQITVWYDHKHENKDDVSPCVGLRFIKGDTLQRYTSEIILTDLGMFYSRLNGVEWLTELSNTLTDYAAERYPKEFEPIKTE